MMTLTMKFKNKSGKVTSIRVPKVKADLTKEAAQEVMDVIIAKNIFFEGLAELSEKVSCEVTSVKELA